MKKFSLKKITAAVSAAAMIATMGTSAFADIDGVGITLNEVKAVKNGDNYDVTIKYTPGTGEYANEIGVTMLTYGATTVKGIDKTNPVNGTTADENKYSSGMQIVGVDQNAVTGNADGKNEFTFKVTTKADEQGYYVTAGKSALVMVSGDKVKSPAVAELRFNKEITSADAITELSGITGTVAEGTSATDANLKSAAESAVEAVIPDVTVTAGAVTYTEGQTKATVAYTATVPAMTEFYTVEKLAENKTDSVYYKNTSDSAITKSGTVEVSYNTTDASDVTAESKAITIAKKEVTEDGSETGTVSTDKIVDKIKAGTAVLKNEDGTLTDEILLTNANVSVSETEGVYTASITVPKNTVSKKGLLTVAGDEGLTYTATITLTSKNVISAISLADSGIPASVEVQVDTEEATPTKDAVVAKLPTVESLADKIATYDTDKTAAFSNFKAEWEYDSTANKAELVVTGFADDASEDITTKYMIASGARIVVATVSVTTKVRPAYNLGDVNGDKSVDVMDASAVQAYAFFNTPLTVPEAGDVNGDESVDVMDASAIQAYAFFNTPFSKSN